MACSGNIIVKCESCGSKNTIPCGDLLEWQEVSEENGAAGKEVQNESEIHTKCKICGSKIEIIATIWTYPDAPSQKSDTFNIDRVSGAELVSHDCDCDL